MRRAQIAQRPGVNPPVARPAEGGGVAKVGDLAGKRVGQEKPLGVNQPLVFYPERIGHLAPNHADGGAVLGHDQGRPDEMQKQHGIQENTIGVGLHGDRVIGRPRNQAPGIAIGVRWGGRLGDGDSPNVGHERDCQAGDGVVVRVKQARRHGDGRAAIGGSAGRAGSERRVANIQGACHEFHLASREGGPSGYVPQRDLFDLGL